MLAAAVVVVIGAAVLAACGLAGFFCLRYLRRQEQRRKQERRWTEFVLRQQDVDRELDGIWHSHRGLAMAARQRPARRQRGVVAQRSAFPSRDSRNVMRPSEILSLLRVADPEPPYRLASWSWT